MKPSKFTCSFCSHEVNWTPEVQSLFENFILRVNGIEFSRFDQGSALFWEMVRKRNNLLSEPDDYYDSFSNCLKCNNCGNKQAKINFVSTVPKSDNKPVSPENLEAYLKSKGLSSVSTDVDSNEESIDMVTSDKQYSTCPACGGDGGYNSSCFQCFGRGYIDS